jgi:hypothetical protein
VYYERESKNRAKCGVIWYYLAQKLCHCKTTIPGDTGIVNSKTFPVIKARSGFIPYRGKGRTAGFKVAFPKTEVLGKPL